MTTFIPSIVLISNPATEMMNNVELENFPVGSIIGISNDISVIRTDFAVFSYRQNRTLQNVLQDRRILVEDTQAQIIIQRFGMTPETANIGRMEGLSSKERRIVLDYLARLR